MAIHDINMEPVGSIIVHTVTIADARIDGAIIGLTIVGLVCYQD